MITMKLSPTGDKHIERSENIKLSPVKSGYFHMEYKWQQLHKLYIIITVYTRHNNLMMAFYASFVHID